VTDVARVFDTILGLDDIRVAERRIVASAKSVIRDAGRAPGCAADVIHFLPDGTRSMWSIGIRNDLEDD
jgi:hypothetical protein